MSALSTAAKHSSEAGGRVRSSVARSTELWKQGALSFSEQTRRFPKMLQIDLVPAAERYFDFVQRTVGINREATITWLDAAKTLSDASGKQVESVGALVRDEVDVARGVAQAQAQKAEEAEKDLEREARKLDRQRARQAHEKAVERYESLTKAELSELLAKRGLPKTGNVDELVERLVAADGR